MMTEAEPVAEQPPVEVRADALVKRLRALGVKLKPDKDTGLARIPNADLCALSIGDILIYVTDPGLFTAAAINAGTFTRPARVRRAATRKKGKAR